MLYLWSVQVACSIDTLDYEDVVIAAFPLVIIVCCAFDHAYVIVTLQMMLGMLLLLEGLPECHVSNRHFNRYLKWNFTEVQ